MVLVRVRRTPVSRMQLLQHDKEWNAIDIITDIGVNANTITLLATRIKQGQECEEARSQSAQPN